MAEYALVIDGTLAGLNELIAANRIHRQKGASLKKQSERVVRQYIHQQLRGAKPKTPVTLHYTFYEPNRRRDHDNVASFAMKVIQDSLVKEGVLPNDGWAEVRGFTCDFSIDKKDPRIVVIISED